jgi:quinol monooxygenase YgiN
MNHIQTTAVFPAIASDRLNEFKQAAEEALMAARDEPGTIQYDWFYNADETRCVLRETFADSEAVLAHAANVRALLPRLIELGGGLQLDVFGRPSAELSAVLATLGSQIYDFAQGK